MKQKKINIKNKIINHLIFHGKKETSRKILLKSIKELQKKSKKQSKKIINLFIILAIPIFKIRKIVKKKKKKKIIEIPSLINLKKAKFSLAIKFILFTLNILKTNYFYEKLCKEILYSIYNKGSSVQLKNNIQKQALTKKHFLRYYKWN